MWRVRGLVEGVALRSVCRLPEEWKQAERQGNHLADLPNQSVSQQVGTRPFVLPEPGTWVTLLPLRSEGGMPWKESTSLRMTATRLLSCCSSRSSRSRGAFLRDR